MALRPRSVIVRVEVGLRPGQPWWWTPQQGALRQVTDYVDLFHLERAKAGGRDTSGGWRARWTVKGRVDGLHGAGAGLVDHFAGPGDCHHGRCSGACGRTPTAPTPSYRRVRSFSDGVDVATAGPASEGRALMPGWEAPLPGFGPPAFQVLFLAGTGRGDRGGPNVNAEVHYCRRVALSVHPDRRQPPLRTLRWHPREASTPDLKQGHTRTSDGIGQRFSIPCQNRSVT